MRADFERLQREYRNMEAMRKVSPMSRRLVPKSAAHSATALLSGVNLLFKARLSLVTSPR